MCLAPSIPSPQAPPATQDAKPADTMQARRPKRAAAPAGGSLLPGPSGVAQGPRHPGASPPLGR